MRQRPALPIASDDGEMGVAVRLASEGEERVIAVAGAGSTRSALAFAELLVSSLAERQRVASIEATAVCDGAWLTVIVTDGLPPGSWSKLARAWRGHAVLELAEARPGVASGLVEMVI
jgi:hypothetical protein